jgi:hypothetical protein
LALDFLFFLGKPGIGKAQEDLAEDGDGILGGFELGVGAQVVGGVPQAFLDFGVVGWHLIS